MLGGGEVALGLGVEERFTLPSGTVAVAAAGHPLNGLPYAVAGGQTRVDLPRWHAVAIVTRPALHAAALRFRGAQLVNAGNTPLRDVYLVGLGRQPDLPPGAARRPAPGEEGGLGAPLTRLTALLPAGTALAEAPGGAIWIALPPLAADPGGAP